MEQSKKYLKLYSVVVLLFAGFTLIQMVLSLIFGDINNATIPEGAPENILDIAKIVILVITVLLLLPQVYVGIKGLRVAKKPNASKGHIIWAEILLVLAILAAISPIAKIIAQGGLYENLSTFFSIVVEISMFFDYIKYAKAVRKEVLSSAN